MLYKNMALLTENSIPSRYPDIPIEKSEGRWWVAKVKPRQEKQLASDFMKNGIEYYLPLYKKITFRPGTNKKRTFIVPLFPGYICFSQNTPKDIFVTGRVVNIVEIKNQKRFISELSAVYNAVENGYSIEPLAGPIPLGTKVEVISGALKGIFGVVVNVKNSMQLILEVQGLGSAVVQIDMGQVRVRSEE